MISPALDIAQSGLAAARERLAVSASNVANVSTEGFRASRVTTQPTAGGGVSTRVADTGTPNPVTTDADGRLATLSNTDVTTEAIEQLPAKHAFYANLAVVRTADEMTRTLIDTIG